MSKKTPNLPPVPPRGDDPKSGATKSERRMAAAELAREHQRKARRRAVLLQVGVGSLLVAVVIGVALVVLKTRDDSVASATAPAGLTADGAVRFGPADAKATLQVVEDFQCPVCAAFESAAGDLLAGYRADPAVAVEYRPIAFLDRASTTEYSTRALNASMCVLEATAEDGWLSFHTALFTNQPPEGGAGLPDAELVSMAADAGAVSGDTESCIEERRYGDWVKQTTNAASDDGVRGTPTVFVNGEALSSFDPGVIEKAVSAASTS